MQETRVRFLGREDLLGEGIGYPLQYSWASLVAQLIKNLPAMWKTWVQSLGWEDSLEKGKSTHSSILTWRIPGGPWSPWGHKESDTTERLPLTHSGISETKSSSKYSDYKGVNGLSSIIISIFSGLDTFFACFILQETFLLASKLCTVAVSPPMRFIWGIIITS